MICNFKTFLLSRKALQKDSTPQSLRFHFKDWVSSLSDSLSQYKPYLPSHYLEHLLGTQGGERIREQFRPLFNKADSSKSIIQAIDLYYDNLVKTLNTAFIRQMQHIPFHCPKNFHPYQSRHSGVGFTFRLVHSNGEIEAKSEIETQSFIGNHSNGPTLQEIKQGIGKNVTLNTALEHDSISTTHKDTIDSEKPHAEDIFFTLYLDKALTAIREFYKKLPQPHLPPQDDLWLTHLGGPRIEFVQTSSICEKCQPYFKALRRMLTDEHIRLPMIMFAQTPFNFNEPPNPVAIINMQGDYHAPALSWSDKPKPNLTTPKDYAHMAILNSSGTAVLPLLWGAPALAYTYWRELASASGSPEYHIWLAEFTSRLFHINDTMPDARTGIHAPVNKENFPLFTTDDNQSVHQSVCLSSLSSTYHEITPINHAFFNLLDCALYLKKQEELTPCETFYWLLFVEISRLSQVQDRPSVTFCDIVFYTEDFIECNKFRSKYLQIVSPKNPEISDLFDLFMSKVQDNVIENLSPENPKLSELFNECMNEVHADTITEPSSNQTELSELFDPSSNEVHAETPQTAGLQNFFTNPNSKHDKPLKENNYFLETAHLPKPALEKLHIFRKERSEYISKHLSI